MTEDTLPRPRAREAVLILAAWMLYGLLSGMQGHFLLAERGHAPAWYHSLATGIVEGVLWALATLAVFWLARRWPLERGRLLASVPVHVFAAVALSVLRAVAMVELSRRLGWIAERPFSRQFLAHFHSYLLVHFLLLGLAHAVAYHARMRERERAAERLAAGLAQARLQALKMQMHPHFLFNTLHAISALVPAEAKQARRMVARLAELLRNTLDHEDTQEVTVREELAFLEPYVEIEQTRLGERLTVTYDVPHEVLDARLPHLVLQPLVENAIRHGVSTRVEPGTVEIAAARSADGRFLEVHVRDDGGGLKEAATGPHPGAEGLALDRPSDGVGLANISHRLEQLYGREHAFDIGERPGGGVAVRLRVPFRTGARGMGNGEDGGR